MKKAAQATPNQRLRRHRELRSWSQRQLADQIGTTSFNVSRWEQGITFPSPYFRQKLCEVFETTAPELDLLASQPTQRTSSQPTSSPSEAGTAPPLSAEVPAPLWNVPYRRNPFFTGREDVLKRLHDALKSGKAAALTQPLAISGLGGIGKTQTAIEYAYRYRDEYQAVLWVRADFREVLVSDFMAIAELLNLPEKDEQDQNRIISAVKRWLNEQSEWLLLLDNVENPEMVEEFIPSAGKGHTLLTTRAQTMGTIAQAIEIEKMELEEGALFILRRAKIIEKDAPLDNVSYAHWTKAKAISQVMDGLPLALDQAAAYIEETACGLAGYLERYRARRAWLLRLRGERVSDHPEPVATTWSLSFEKSKQANPAAAELLQLCAFLHPDAIPEEIITEGAPDLGPILQPIAADLLGLDAAIRELRKYSLVRRDPEARVLNVHRLVQAVLRDQMDEDTQSLWAERTVRAVNRAFPEVEFATWQRCQQYLPLVQACAALIEKWDIDCIEATQLLHRAGNYLRERAQYREAGLLLKQALVIREQVLGLGHPNVASSLDDLAELYCAQGWYTQAEPLCQRALTIREQTLGSEHPDVAESLNDLALIYDWEGKSAQAELLYQRAIAILERTLGPEHPKTATSLTNLALLYYVLGKYVQAESLSQRAFVAREHILGPDHPDVAQSLNALALIYLAQGKYAQAEPLCLRSLDIREQAFGTEHPRVARSFITLALLYTAQSEYDKAEQLLTKSLAIYEQAVGTEHPDVAYSLDALASLYLAQGKHSQAEKFAQRALVIREQALEPEYPEVATSLNTLAEVYLAQGKYAQAEPLLQRALAIREQTLGAEHPHVAQTLTHLGWLYYTQGKYVQAEPLLTRALAIREQSLGPNHPDVAKSLENYADLLRRTNRQTEAAKLEARAKAIRARKIEQNT